MENSFIIKLDTPSLRIMEATVLEGPLVELPRLTGDYAMHALYVLSGLLMKSNEIICKAETCMHLENTETLRNINVLQPAKLLLISSCTSPQYSNTLEADASTEDSRAFFGRKIASAIRTSLTVDQDWIDQLLATLHIRAPFEGDMLNRYTELFLSVLSELSLEPLRLNKAYCARICAHWTINGLEPEQTFSEVIRFIAQLYEDLFLPRIDNPLVRKAIFWSLTNTPENKTVKLVAEKLFVNRTHLSERFKQLAGISLSAYIIRVKMYGAMLLLIDDTLNYSYVLDILGYKDDAHFSKNFLKYVGYLPNEYVKRFHAFSK